MEKIYLYNDEGFYLWEEEATSGLDYPNSTPIKPDEAYLADPDFSIKFNKERQVWEYDRKKPRESITYVPLVLDEPEALLPGYEPVDTLEERENVTEPI